MPLDYLSALGAAYLNGAGVGRDPIEAARRFDRACALGDALGCRARQVVRDARVGGRGVGLTPALLDVELARSIDAVAACRRRSASARSAAVSVTVRFVVDPEGAVAAAAHLGEVVACHERGLAAQPDASGQVVVRFVIGGDGVVASSVVTRSTYPLPWVARCVADAVRGWRFPRPTGGGVVTVNYPFNLQLPALDAR